ncbi:MAG: pyridoxamine 5'-phosphate oxidase [Bacteroidetes bacterium]|nr:pyridoxamine 5'-phosphate oxidase [Bacteroidota bacterium]MCH8169873.1 pyridoxamine 5'-phosphate oxidase [Bacteroidota bacterium]
MNNDSLTNLRGEVYKNQLIESMMEHNPFNQFNLWMKEALDVKIVHANAMTLATVNNKGVPSARTVLLKELDDSGFVFYTNYESEKAKDLNENPNASIVFFWKEFERQVRITGIVEKITKEESEIYFKSRPFESKLGAWASKQSEEIPNRDYLINKYNEVKEKFKETEITLPPFWGGYRLLPNIFEFWQGREMRLHDRIKYEKVKNEWRLFRLSP